MLCCAVLCCACDGTGRYIDQQLTYFSTAGTEFAAEWLDSIESWSPFYINDRMVARRPVHTCYPFRSISSSVWY